MATNRGVVYVSQGKVEVRPIDYPKLLTPRGRTANHGVILRCSSMPTARSSDKSAARPIAHAHALSPG